MIAKCAGECGRLLSVASTEHIYLCRSCWATLFSILFKLIRTGREVCTVNKPATEELS